jgi:5S rRNA maturation endonuclease (ribonuclease M5)
MKFDSVPIILINPTMLVCYANDDSLVIFNTRGTFYPLTFQWIGKGGKVDWQRAGLESSQVYANVKNYKIQMKFAKVEADSVEFFNKKFFTFSLVGKFSDKVLANVTEDKAQYPTFSSYDKTIGIKNLFKNVDYIGGFAMEGAKILGTGSKTDDAKLVFKKNNKEFVRITSKLFVIRTDRINSANASITIYHENDSIYNPVLTMKYIDEKKELTLTRDERITMISPWFDSWHQIEIYCESLTWKLNEPRMNFEMMKGPNQEGRAVFESANYFSVQRYDKLQGIDEFNPLFILRKYSEKYKTRNFTLDQIVTFMQRPPEQVEAQLITLAYKGFLFYDPDDKTGRIKDKLINYVKAKDAKIDYDVIFFNSTVTAKSNGILSLDSFDLVLQGVPKVFLSDSQQVYIYPSKEQVILKKDGDFLFSGKVEAGLFDYYTKMSSFEYNKFKLNLPFVDSMAVYVRSRKIDPKTQTYPLVKVSTYITNLSGDLLIDDPKNKSGLKKFPDYPIFHSNNVSYANWEKRGVYGSVYKKDKFFYSVDPFTLKSIGSFQTDSLQFKGVLNSAGIFPDIREPLKVRPDYSFGIESNTGPGGMPAYGGKGTYYSKIDMSNKGLRGDGKLDYLNSTSVSDDFVFFPDSMKTVAKSFITSELSSPVECPTVKGDSVKELWKPYKNILRVTSISKDISMYNGQSSIAGSLNLTPAGLTGQGTVKIRDAEMQAFLFEFKRRTFDATVDVFRIKSVNLAALSISTRNYVTHFDFDQLKGEFKSSRGSSRVDFPVDQYACTMDRFDWLVEKRSIRLYNERNQQVNAADTMSTEKLVDYTFPGTEFVSTHPRQDSLRFFSQQATYDLNTNIISAEDVKIIRVADAAIFPDSGKVYIHPEARMRPLAKAAIIANVNNKFHRFYNCDLSIASRKRYTGTGYYDYVERDNNKQQIFFSRIAVDTTGETVAEGNILDTTRFYLSPEFEFRGTINLRASQRNLTFEGGFRPVMDCFPKAKLWTYFVSDINPLQVMIPLENPLRDLHFQKLGLGIMFSNSTNRVYPAFFSPKQSFSDSTMVTSLGKIDYDLSNGSYRIMEMDRRKDPALPGNSLTMSTSDCVLHGSGKINLSLNSGNLKLGSWGTMDHYVISDSTKTRVAIALDFPFPEDCMTKFSGQLSSTNLQGLVFSTSPYLEAMKTLLGKKEFDKVKSEMEMVGRFKRFPDELIRTIFLADVKLRWDTLNKTWVSYGPIAIGCIGKVQVNKYVNGIIEFQKKKNGDDFTFYFELSKNDWYFFNYRNNLLMALSSNSQFNDAVEEAVKSSTEQKRIAKLAKGYRYTIGTDRKKREFVRKYETTP